LILILFTPRLHLMAAKLVALPIVEHWDCHQCAACCRETVIRLHVDDVARLRTQQWEKQPEFQGVRVVRRSALLGGTPLLAHKADGSCVFLTAAGRCRIHEVFGADAKPLVCRQFPLQVVRWERKSFATVLRSCPSAAADRGRAVSEHLSFLTRLLQDEEPRAASSCVVRGVRRGWDDFERVASAVQRCLTDERKPLVWRVVKCVRFCNLIEQCRWKHLAPESVAGVVQAAEELSEHELGELFRDRVTPDKSAGRLFRRLGAHFIRCVSGGKPTRTLRDHWRAMRASGRLAKAQITPAGLHPRFGAISSELLERSLGPLGYSVLSPLDRFLAAHAVSRRYALSQSTTSLVDSARRLAFMYPMAMWMLRWLAVDREPVVEDMVEIVVALERGMVMKGLDRAVRWLAECGELERLAAWYAR
jgi:lysine-N-methylase